MSDAVRVSVHTRLTAEQIDETLALVAATTAHDGLAPLSEHVMLHLRHGGDRDDLHFLAYLGDDLAGYAHLDATDAVRGPIAELAVHPQMRRQGVGQALLDGVRTQSPTGHLRLWAHGEQAGAKALAESLGYRGIRVLWQMRRSLRLPLPAYALPSGCTLRPFRPGPDDAEWLALNALAFHDHPEQGVWTQADLERRLAEPWFSPAGFLIAECDGRMVGFHWTKVHGTDHHGHEPIGEVYVIGTHPDFRGRGLGKALMLAGLASLRDRGLDEAMLYVDSDNAEAVALYRDLGFALWDTDTEFTSAPLP